MTKNSDTGEIQKMVADPYKVLGVSPDSSDEEIKKIGEGSFGKVYVSSNTKTGELFAAKLVSKK